MLEKNKIYLSPPHIGDAEYEKVNAALKSGWISPNGSFIDEFSDKLAHYFNKKILLTNSGTSSIHLALKIAEIKENDFVLCSNFTFAATAFPILYQKAKPIFIGAEENSWNISPTYLEEAIYKLKKQNIHPKALILAHIYGMPSKLDMIIQICKENNILLIEDAAEALGSKYKQLPLGAHGNSGVLSFNGNKIITCSSGGALILDSNEKLSFAKKLSTQAKEKNIDYYVHNEIGYNYAQSNILAAIGSAQFDNLTNKVEKRREIFQKYLDFFKNKVDVTYQIEDINSFSNRWLSTYIFPENLNKKIKETLEINNIESRYLWNPLNKQKVFNNYLYFGNEKLEQKLFSNGLSLPSGNNLTDQDFNRILDTLKTIL